MEVSPLRTPGALHGARSVHAARSQTERLAHTGNQLRQSRLGSQSVTSNVRIQETFIPLPTDFETFVPWACRQLRLSVVIQVEAHSNIDTTKKYPVETIKEYDSEDDADGGVVMSIKASLKSSTSNRIVPITTMYDTNNRLLEIIIASCNIVPRKLIKTLGLCLTFYPTLMRFTITKCKIDPAIFYEIGNMLPYSSITEICFDNTYVKELNYYSVLSEPTHIKRFSLNNCRINSVALEILCEHIEKYAPDLQILELAHNSISDKGAIALGNLLKKNRSLLHLNLCGNHITDDGAVYMMNYLKNFKLTPQDVTELRKRKLVHYKNKLKKYECSTQAVRPKELLELSKELSRQNTRPKIKSGATPVAMNAAVKTKKTGRGSQTISDKKNVDMKLPTPIHKKSFVDVFDEDHTTFEKGNYFCSGNFRLCSLNVAYNCLEYITIEKAYEVMKYQNEFILKPDKFTGLMRLVLDGIEVWTPKTAIQANWIKTYLEKAVLIPRSTEKGKSVSDLSSARAKGKKRPGSD